MPAEVAFQTKPEIALALLDQARAWGVPHRCVVADADYGDNPNFLAGLEARQERYVVAVRTDFRVSAAAAGDEPRAAGGCSCSRACPAGSGARFAGARAAKAGCARSSWRCACWRVTSDGQRHVGWLIGERATRGQPEERKYYWSNLPATATLEELAEYAHRRYAVEQFHEEAKGEVGWDQYQGRLWPGFHRHAVTVMLAYSFLVWLELRQRRSQPRRGRPRDPFSPSAGSHADARCQRSIARSPGGCATKPCSGG